MMKSYTDHNDIPWRKYGFIMSDPPWKYENWSEKGEEKNASAKYDCMTINDLIKMPVSLWAADDCALWLWATNPMIDVQIKCLQSWGFTFKTSGHWHKTTKNGKQHFGTGYILRSSGEPFLIGTIGKPFFANNVRSTFDTKIVYGKNKRPLHSAKPDEAYAIAEALCPRAENRLDMFSRKTRSGWDAFGHEVGKLDGEY